jgi:hypothetical protein
MVGHSSPVLIFKIALAPFAGPMTPVWSGLSVAACKADSLAQTESDFINSWNICQRQMLLNFGDAALRDSDTILARISSGVWYRQRDASNGSSNLTFM